MLFNTGEFWGFFALVAFAYFALPHRLRWLLLLVASYVFYMAWEPTYALLILASTVVDYTVAMRLDRAEGRHARRAWLATSLVANLGILFTFKYYNFLATTVNSVLGREGGGLPYAEWLLPVGISFYTFQTLSYTIEVFRREQPPERHFGRFALYVSFFPQLVAGPIERPQNLLPQLTRRVQIDASRILGGLELMAWGLFKKSVIADNAALLVDDIYGRSNAYDGAYLTLGTVLFGFQIYCDFSGYSDMAIGAARVLGIDLMRNFRQPYHAASIPEFWRRWHISLSTWFRDYVYVPLGGNRAGVSRQLLNLLIVFVVSGVWHGANWTFVIWGALHGSFMVISRLTKPMRDAVADRLPVPTLLLRPLGVVVTFVLVTFTWIFFRSDDVAQSWQIVTNLHTGWEHAFNFVRLAKVVEHVGLGAVGGWNLLAAIAAMELVHLLAARSPDGSARTVLAGQSQLLRWIAYSGLLWWIFLFGNFEDQPFIYFVF